MSTTSRVAAAVAAGYVLGRFKKLRMAVMVGSALANDDVRHSMLGVVKQGSDRLGSSSAGRTLSQQVGSKLVAAGKSAAIAATASRVDALSDRLAARSEGLRDTARESTSDDDAERDEREEDVEADEAAERDTDEEPDTEESSEDDDEPDEDEPVTRSTRRRRGAAPGRASGS